MENNKNYVFDEGMKVHFLEFLLKHHKAPNVKLIYCSIDKNDNINLNIVFNNRVNNFSYILQAYTFENLHSYPSVKEIGQTKFSLMSSNNSIYIGNSSANSFGLNIGKNMLAGVEYLAKIWGYSKLELESKQSAKQFWEKQKFVKTNIDENEKSDLTHMTKKVENFDIFKQFELNPAFEKFSEQQQQFLKNVNLKLSTYYSNLNQDAIKE